MKLVKNLIIEIISFFDKNLQTEAEKEILKVLKNISLEKNNYVNQDPNTPQKEKALQKALLSIKSEALVPIKTSISLALLELKWNVDNGSFYEKNSGIGKPYLNGNMNSELIGPRNGIFKSDECRLGLFLLEPNIFYKDHKHEAPELYLNLTNGTDWRFDNMVWTEKKSGSIVYNESYRVHAMKVNEQPFLSIWCWPYDSAMKCTLVPRKDWYDLENKLV